MMKVEWAKLIPIFTKIILVLMLKLSDLNFKGDGMRFLDELFQIFQITNCFLMETKCINILGHIFDLLKLANKY